MQTKQMHFQSIGLPAVGNSELGRDSAELGWSGYRDQEPFTHLRAHFQTVESWSQVLHAFSSLVGRDGFAWAHVAHYRNQAMRHASCDDQRGHNQVEHGFPLDMHLNTPKATINYDKELN
jgi:hypothetical protein